MAGKFDELAGGLEKLLKSGIGAMRNKHDAESLEMTASERRAESKQRMQQVGTAIFGKHNEENTALDKGKLLEGGAKIASGDIVGGATDLATEKIRQTKAAIKGTAEHGLNVMDPNRGITSASEGMRSAGSAMDLADPTGTLSAPVKFGAALIETIDKVKSWGNALQDANEKFAEFSGAMSAVAAQRETRDIIRSMESGNARAESAGSLSQAMGDFQDALRPIEDKIGNFKNEIGAFFLPYLTQFVDGMKKMIWWIDWQTENDEDGTPDWVREAEEVDWTMDGRPRSLRG